MQNDNMHLSELGENNLLQRIATPWKAYTPAEWVGIGDDCAVLPFSPIALPTHRLLVSTDTLVENIHFLNHVITPQELGHKALAVNGSDMAAMGGTPTAVFLALSVPPTLSTRWMDDFFEGFNKLAHQHNIVLAGGDLTRSPGLIVINVTILGHAHGACIKLRSTGQPGDVVCVTGMLGDSGGGLRLILESSAPTSAPSESEYARAESVLRRHHHCPEPHLSQGRWLATQPAVHAMMDVSDGIDTDLRRLLAASQCGAQIWLERLPLSEELIRVARRHHWNVYELAATAGEDYCLVCTIAADAYPALARTYQQAFGTSLYAIGTLTSQANTLEYWQNDQPVTLTSSGFQHFPK